MNDVSYKAMRFSFAKMKRWEKRD